MGTNRIRVGGMVDAHGIVGSRCNCGMEQRRKNKTEKKAGEGATVAAAHAEDKCKQSFTSEAQGKKATSAAEIEERENTMDATDSGESMREEKKLG